MRNFGHKGKKRCHFSVSVSHTLLFVACWRQAVGPPFSVKKIQIGFASVTSRYEAATTAIS